MPSVYITSRRTHAWASFRQSSSLFLTDEVENKPPQPLHSEPPPLLSNLVYESPVLREYVTHTAGEREGLLQNFFNWKDRPEPSSILWIYFKMMWNCHFLRKWSKDNCAHCRHAALLAVGWLPACFQRNALSWRGLSLWAHLPSPVFIKRWSSNSLRLTKLRKRQIQIKN